MIKKPLIFLLLFTALHAQTTFLEKDIAQFCTTKNPFFSTIVLQTDIVKAKELFYKGAFDTQLAATYEKKEYPISKASYHNISLVQPLKNGVELALQYRKAEGTQEYNNIKTGRDGEFIASLLVPLNNLLYHTGERDVNYKMAKLQTKITKQQVHRLLQGFYKDIAELYYKLIYQKSLLLNEKALLKKSKNRLEFIKKEVKAGKKAPIEITQNKHMILQRKERVLDAKNKFLQLKKSLITYLGINQSFFDQHYTLPQLTIKTYPYKRATFYINKAYTQRTELTELSYKKARITQQKRLNQLHAYPKINLRANSLYDLTYKQDGYKLSAELSFALQRGKYKGEDEQLQQNLLLIASKRERLKETISLTLSNILQNIDFLQQKKDLYEEEIQLSQKLEDAERKRYIEGVSNLIFVNQREIDALQAEQKLLNNQLQRERSKLQLDYETGEIIKNLLL